MKFTVTQENFSHGLFMVSHVAAKSANLPVLQNVLIEANESGIKLTATNLEIGMSCLVRGKIDHTGAFTVQSKLLADFVGLLPKTNLEVASVSDAQGNSALTVTSGESETKLKGIPAADFPLIPAVERQGGATCAADDLRAAIAQVVFAVSQSETRPEINGVLLQFAGHELTLTATDSYRLAERKVHLLTPLREPQHVIVPARALQELLRALSGFKDPAALAPVENVELFVAENQILGVAGGVEIVSRLVEGQYPDYRQIIPQQSSTTGKIATAELAKAAKTASLFSRGGIYDVALAFEPERRQVVLSAANAQLGENITRVGANITGVPNRTVLNSRYLLDGLQNMEAEEVEFHLIDTASPCVIKPRGKANYLYLVMPIKQ